jgi:hypothetical protein
VISVLAMSPSGEVFFTRDGRGVVRQHRRLGHHDPLEVSEATVAAVVDQYAYDRVDTECKDWADVEAFVEGAITRTPSKVEDLPVNMVIARSAAEIMETWLQSPADLPLIVPAVNRLLANNAVAADSDLKAALLSLSTRAAKILVEPIAPTPQMWFTVRTARPSRLERTLAMFDMALAA